MNTTNKPTTAIAVNGVTKIFGNGPSAFTALDNVSVDIEDNEFFTLLGPSGCGKTTLLRMIAGFEHPTAGEILLHGEQIAHLPPYQRSVNTVFQNYALFPHMTVAENIAFGLQMQKQPKAKIRETVAEMLDLVKMTAMKDRKTNQISGGQQQRVALARALAPHPKVLLLDEPLSALDYKLRKDMQLELKRLQSDTGITFIFVTHDQEEALTMSDRVAVMSSGNILQVGAPHEIYDRPAVRFVADFIGDTNFLNAEITNISATEGADDSGSQSAEVALAAGGSATALVNSSYKNKEKVTVAIRPEQVTLSVNPDEGMIRAKVNHIVYFGTDTHYHLTLPSEESFTARVQNTHGREAHFAEGSDVSIVVPASAIQVLRD